MKSPVHEHAIGNLEPMAYQAKDAEVDDHAAPEEPSLWRKITKLIGFMKLKRT